MIKKLSALFAVISILLQPLALTKARAEQCNDWNAFYPICYPVGHIYGLYEGFNTNYLGQVQAYAGYSSDTPRNITLTYIEKETGGFSRSKLAGGVPSITHTNARSVAIYSEYYWPNTCAGFEYVSVSVRIVDNVRHAAVMTYEH